MNFPSIRWYTEQFGRMIPINIVPNYHGDKKYKLYYDKNMIEYTYYSNNIKTSLSEYVEEYVREMDKLVSVIENYIDEYKGLQYNPSNNLSEINANRAAMTYVLLKAMRSYEFIQITDYNNRDRDLYPYNLGENSSLLSYFLCEKDYFTFKGRLYCYKPLEEYKQLDLSICIPNSRGYYNVNASVYVIMKKCYSWNDLIELLPYSIVINRTNDTFTFLNKWKTLIYTLDDNNDNDNGNRDVILIDESIDYSNYVIEFLETKEKYIEYLVLFNKVMRNYNLTWSKLDKDYELEQYSFLFYLGNN